jgi:hypothetical protein
MCQFQSGTFECRGDGYVWDADCDGYDPEDRSMPCPACNTLAFLEARKEEAETTGWWEANGVSGDGADIWESAVAAARSWNPEAAEAALRAIGSVDALVADDEAEDGVVVKTFRYAA